MAKSSQFKQERESDYNANYVPSKKPAEFMVSSNVNFGAYYEVALKRRGLTGFNLLQILETRLDNVIYRLGFAESRAQARLLVTHGHFTVNGRRVDIPSMNLNIGDTVSVRSGSLGLTFFKDLPALAESKAILPWLTRDMKTLSGGVTRLPERSEIDGNLQEQLIVEYYSR